MFIIVGCSPRIYKIMQLSKNMILKKSGSYDENGVTWCKVNFVFFFFLLQDRRSSRQKCRKHGEDAPLMSSVLSLRG